MGAVAANALNFRCWTSPGFPIDDSPPTAMPRRGHAPGDFQIHDVPALRLVVVILAVVAVAIAVGPSRLAGDVVLRERVSFGREHRVDLLLCRRTFNFAHSALVPARLLLGRSSATSGPKERNQAPPYRQRSVPP
jgi:hypothetical protein